MSASCHDHRARVACSPARRIFVLPLLGEEQVDGDAERDEVAMDEPAVRRPRCSSRPRTRRRSASATAASARASSAQPRQRRPQSGARFIDDGGAPAVSAAASPVKRELRGRATPAARACCGDPDLAQPVRVFERLRRLAPRRWPTAGITSPANRRASASSNSQDLSRFWHRGRHPG